MLKHYAVNTVGRDLIVGDIHGCFSRLQGELDALGFDPERDRLFSVGDLVDRGPESAQALEWLGKPWFHAVQGNHEQLFVDYHRGLIPAGYYAQNGGGWAVGMTPEERQPLVDAMLALPIAIELDTAHGPVGIVHANCPRQSWGELRADLKDAKPLPSDRPGQMFIGDVRCSCVWDRSRVGMGDDSGVTGVRAVVVGHTPVQAPLTLGNVHHIDTGAVFGRSFTILDAASLKPAQALACAA